MLPPRLKAAQLICHVLPPMGSGRISDLIYPRSQGRSDSRRFVVQARTGSYFTGVTDDFNASRFAVHGYNVWRNWVIALALSSAGDTIVEIGANVGTETVGFSDLVGAGGRVFAFEPLPDNLTALEKTLPLATHDNVELMPLAIGAESATLQFAAPPPTARSQGTGHILGPQESQRGSVIYHDEQVDWPVIDVECVTLDSLTDRIGPARLVFVDAEGAEVGILRGAREYLRAHRPGMVVEASPDHLARSETSVEELHATLAELDYQSFAIRRLNLEPLTAPDSSIAPGNWLCIPTSRPEDVRRLEPYLRRCALAPCVPWLNPLCSSR